jgi:hypothetical protein
MKQILTVATVGDLKPGDIIDTQPLYGDREGGGYLTIQPLWVVIDNTISDDKAKTPVSRVTIETKGG